MNFTNSPYETMMKRPPRSGAPALPKAPGGSRCHGCAYWRGIACVSCYRELLGGQARPRGTGR